MSRSKRRLPEESRWLRVLGTLNECQARLFVADKALDQGRGGISRLSEFTGMSRTTITKAVAELNSRNLDPAHSFCEDGLRERVIYGRRMNPTCSALT